MARLRSRPPLFRSKKRQTTTNAVRRDVSNGSLGGHSTSEDNFFLDSYQSGFKSTQQLAIDFSKFENHAFFSPARAKVDLALYKSINEYPYTGTQEQIDEFLFRLTGFERYVFNSIPRNIGYLFFSGTQIGESTGGTYIDVSPISGKNFYEAPGSTGALCLEVGQSPFEIEAHVFVPENANGNQVIAQRLGTGASYTLALSESASTTNCKILFLVSSASDSYLVASGTLLKGDFSHVRACLFEEDDGKKAIIYTNDYLLASSSDTQDFGSLTFGTASLIIGSGSSHQILDYSFVPAQTLSGAIDELRFFIDQRSEQSVEQFKDRQMFSTSSLSLYFRFDEPAGPYDMKSVVLDYSGKCLHSSITNYKQSLRITGSIQVPLQNQNSFFSPVLYPDFSDFEDLITDLLTSASNYDDQNPNIVTRLVPPHYLIESAQASGISDPDGGIGVAPELLHVPGTGGIQNISPLLKTLIVISVSLDEIKQFIDSMSSLLAVELGDEDQISSQMIRYAADYFGIDLPNFFAKSTSEQFSFGNNVQSDSFSNYTLRSLRDDLWRRILGNMSYINASKGTKGAVRSILLSSGIIPENFFTIREYGMSGESRLNDLRDQSIEVTSMIDFSGSLNTPVGPFIPPGVRNGSQRIISSYLSASRVEIGTPEARGAFVNSDTYAPYGISNNPSDGLLTSGCFSLEASYVFDSRIDHPPSQSLMRLMTTGSTSPNDFLVANVFYTQESEDSGSLYLSLKPSAEIFAVAPSPLVLAITGVNLFDGERWTVGIEKTREDFINALSSSYTLRCARQVGGKVNLFTTSAFYAETAASPAQDVFENFLPTFNASGSYLIIGSQSITPTTRLLNSDSSYYSTLFSGKVSHIRFYSSRTGDESFVEHAKNYANMGLDNPEIGLGFDLVQSGAFERMRIDASCDQATTASDSSGNIRIFDFSQNLLHISGSGFGPNIDVIRPYVVSIDRFSPRFDLQQVSNKVRIRGLDDPHGGDPSYVIAGPVYEIYNSDEITDDVRFAIEHSSIKALNEDIISTIGNTQYLDDALGQPSGFYNDSYADLDHFSDVYFNRLTGKIDFMRTYDVFRWVDVALSNLVESVLPKRTKFMGINYVIEPHALERGKVKYLSYQSTVLTNMEYSDPVTISSAISPSAFSLFDLSFRASIR